MINNNFEGFEGNENRLTELSIEKHMEKDVMGLTQRCIKERIIPNDLKTTETGQCRAVLIRRVQEKILALLCEQSKLS
jgi:hypothetical protein